MCVQTSKREDDYERSIRDLNARLINVSTRVITAKYHVVYKY